jgi:hypothetical protein
LVSSRPPPHPAHIKSAESVMGVIRGEGREMREERGEGREKIRG